MPDLFWVIFDGLPATYVEAELLGRGQPANVHIKVILPTSSQMTLDVNAGNPCHRVKKQPLTVWLL